MSVFNILCVFALNFRLKPWAYKRVLNLIKLREDSVGKKWTNIHSSNCTYLNNICFGQTSLFRKSDFCFWLKVWLNFMCCSLNNMCCLVAYVPEEAFNSRLAYLYYESLIKKWKNMTGHEWWWCDTAWCEAVLLLLSNFSSCIRISLLSNCTVAEKQHTKAVVYIYSHCSLNSRR